MNILNFIYDLTNSDALYYVLIILLVIISLVMVYLMYTQNKEISKHLMERQNNERKKEAEQQPEISKFKEIDSLDGREELLEVSKMTIPKHLEYTQTLFSNTELQELQDIAKDLEDNYKDRKNDIEIYEEEQEESAIISYEELLSKTQAIPKIEEIEEIKKDTQKEVKITDEAYSHEEDFLNRLKNLNNNLK